VDSALHDHFVDNLRDTKFLTAGDDSVRAISPAPSTESSEGGTGSDSVSDVFHDSLPRYGVKRTNDRWCVGYLNMLRYASFVNVYSRSRLTLPYS